MRGGIGGQFVNWHRVTRGSSTPVLLFDGVHGISETIGEGVRKILGCFLDIAPMLCNQAQVGDGEEGEKSEKSSDAHGCPLLDVVIMAPSGAPWGRRWTVCQLAQGDPGE